jgi:hypothetical protein
MPSVRIILDLEVADENEAAKVVASLEAQFPDRNLPSQYTAALDDSSKSLDDARKALANPASGAQVAP